jgi:protein translocase SecG subunit
MGSSALNTVYSVMLGLGLFVAVVYVLLVLITGKGDAMSGGNSVRTTFKGKASFEDRMSQVTFGLAVCFMFLMLALDFVQQRISFVQ